MKTQNRKKTRVRITALVLVASLFLGLLVSGVAVLVESGTEGHSHDTHEHLEAN